jgi:hypothetical protein
MSMKARRRIPILANSNAGPTLRISPICREISVILSRQISQKHNES